MIFSFFSDHFFLGLKLGALTLEKYKIQGSNRVQRIFLFSGKPILLILLNKNWYSLINATDGLVNTGKTQPDDIKKLVAKIRKKGISISSFGIGSDFDEELMKNISE